MAFRFFLVAVLAAGLTGAAPSARMQPDAAQDVLDRVRATYRDLQSLGLKAELATDFANPGGPVVSETHHVTTYYRAPRHFYFEFTEDETAGGDRVTIWCDGGDFQSWWKTTAVHEVYSGGRGATAFATASYPTRGSALHVAPLLFPQAQLHGPLTDFRPNAAPAREMLGGREVLRLSGESTGHFGPARPTTIWVDSKTNLMVKLLEDTPRGSPGGSVNRMATSFVTEANPSLEDSFFRFQVPGPYAVR